MEDPNGACAMYDGVPCTVNNATCCYNTDKWCPGYANDPTVVCERYDRGAYPVGDLTYYPNSMTDAYAYAPFPNAIFWNWCTIIILGIGNLGALDFQARCMSANTPRAARIGCIIAGCFTFFIGIPFAYMGAITRCVRENRSGDMMRRVLSDDFLCSTASTTGPTPCILPSTRTPVPRRWELHSAPSGNRTESPSSSCWRTM